MAFNIDIGFATQAGRKPGNEDFCAAMLPDPGQEGMGDIVVLVTDGLYGVLTDRRLQALAGLQATDSAPLASQNLVNAALAAGSQDNITAVVVRVLGLLDASLPDVNRRAQGLPIPPRLMKVGEVIDGLCVTALVADSGINLLYQVRIQRQPGAVCAKDAAPRPGARRAGDENAKYRKAANSVGECPDLRNCLRMV